MDRIDIHTEVPRADFESSITDEEHRLWHALCRSASILQGAWNGTTAHQSGDSAVAYHRILKLSCTISDLTAEENIQPTHLVEVLRTLRSPKGVMV